MSEKAVYVGSTKALVGITTQASPSMSRYCADPFEKFEEIWLTSRWHEPLPTSADAPEPFQTSLTMPASES